MNRMIDVALQLLSCIVESLKTTFLSLSCTFTCIKLVIYFVSLHLKGPSANISVCEEAGRHQGWSTEEGKTDGRHYEQTTETIHQGSSEMPEGTGENHKFFYNLD